MSPGRPAVLIGFAYPVAWINALVGVTIVFAIPASRKFTASTR